MSNSILSWKNFKSSHNPKLQNKFPSKDISWTSLETSLQTTLATFGIGWANAVTDYSVVKEDRESDVVVWVWADSLGTVLK